MKNNLKIWKFKTQGCVWSEIATTKNMVFIGSTDGYVYCLTKRTGQLKWKYKYFEYSSYDNDDDYDYDDYDGWDVNEYDEYGNELDLSGDPPNPWDPLFDKDENDRTYGGSLSVHDNYIIIAYGGMLHIIEIQSGVKKTIIEFLYQNQYFYKDGFIIYITYTLSDCLIQKSLRGDIKDIFLTIEKVETGKICIKEKRNGKKTMNLESYLENFLVKVHKGIGQIYYTKQINIIDRYSIVYEESEWFLRDNYSKNNIFNSSIFEFDKAILYNDKLLIINEYDTIQLLKIPSLDLIWERSRFDFYTGYPNPLLLKYYSWKNPNNIFVVEINTKSTVASEIVCDPVGDIIQYLDPILENGLLYIPASNYDPPGFQIVNLSNGKEVIVFNNIIEILTIKRYELQQIIKRFYWKKNRIMDNITSIWKLLKCLTNRLFFVKQCIKRLNSDDFPNRLIYLGNDGKNTFRYNIRSNSKIWVVESGRWIREAPLIDDEYIFIGCNNGEIVSIKND